MPMTDFETEVTQFVTDCLRHYHPRTRPAYPKVLHDAIWGTLSISAAEIDVIDCPLVQRLRFISQTGLAFFTFPSARHSRFEHSVGVMAMATKMATALNESAGVSDPSITPRQLQELRIAALLHDIGHGFFSHISETMYGAHAWIQDVKRQPDMAHAKPHEILSWLMVRSPAFSTLFAKLQKKHRSTEADFADARLENVADLILGLYPEDPDGQAYLGDILNGPFDADKLDYIARDAYFTGLTMSVDIERLLTTLRVMWDPEGEDGSNRRTRRLVARLTGSMALEQVLLSKLRLYNVLYHHPKVRAADRMMTNIADYIREHEGVLSDSPVASVDQDLEPAIVLHSPVDYLKFSDEDFLALRYHKDRHLRRMIRSIRERELPVKALVISRRTLTDRDALRRILSKWVFSCDARDMQKSLEKKIYAEIPVQDKEGYIADDIIVDIPELPMLTEAPLMKVVTHDQHGQEKLESLNDVTRVHDWCGTSMINKWRGHVFSPPALQIATNRAAKSVFKRHGFTFHRLATTLANIHD